MDASPERLISLDLGAGRGEYDLGLDPRRDEVREQRPEALVRPAHLLREWVEIEDTHG
jgi:hypothetical protein